jgi:two-component system, chemotaxis family, sensor kinase CheA
LKNKQQLTQKVICGRMEIEMSDLNNNEQMLDMYVFETSQNIEQLENCILETEKSNGYSQNAINEIFRIMHTIKGSSAMMLFNCIAEIAHAMEDLFYYLREAKPLHVDNQALTDLLLEGVDYIKLELEKIKSSEFEESECSLIISRIENLLNDLKSRNSTDTTVERPISGEKQQYYIIPDKPSTINANSYYKAIVYFEDDCGMENIRAYTVVHNLKHITKDLFYHPDDIMENEDSSQEIREKGLLIYLSTDKTHTQMKEILGETVFLKSLKLDKLDEVDFRKLLDQQNRPVEEIQIKRPTVMERGEAEGEKDSHGSSPGQNIISVNIAKLDLLMDMVGEMVISETLVTQNPDLIGLELMENFQKAARQHHKIISEVQDLVMSIRMVPLAATFHKMHRLLRDMNKNLKKETELILIGEETEVDKKIIEHISDPLMHLVRNCIDHGIESPEERKAKGKNKEGKVIIEAKNAGSDVLIQIKDDGKGLNKEKILIKAQEQGIINKPTSEMTEREIYNLIMLPGFSTKDDVSEYSGRGVGMDVVTKNIEAIGGTIIIDSTEGKGTIITLKIPLTLAIIDGMNIKVGTSRYTVPITAIKESFRPATSDLIVDPDGNEMIMVRGNCYLIKRLHDIYGVDTEVKKFTDGILIMVEQDERICCLFADELLGQQQVVVKALPEYIKNIKKIQGISGCTLLGDGSISLILDIAGLAN